MLHTVPCFPLFACRKVIATKSITSPPSRLIAEDTGLGIRRTRNLVVVSVTSRERTQEMKEKFYAELCRELKENCAIDPNDVIVSIVTNSAADWSFGNGKAQFITGEL
jgi:Tautomerase enzyme